MIQTWRSFSSSVVIVLCTAVVFAGGLEPSCRTWQWVNPQPPSHNLEGAAAGDPGVVAVGTFGTILFSPAGTSWTEVASGTTANLWDVIWTGHDFIAVGDDGAVVRSEDGIDWRVLRTNTDADFKCIVFGGGKFVAGGPTFSSANGNTLFSSTDGEDWIGHQVGGWNNSFSDIAWGDGVFVAVGEHYSAASTDGENWLDQSQYAFEDSYSVSVVWANSRFVAIPYSRGAVLTSLDGLQWEVVEHTTYALWASDLSWTGEAFVAVGEGYSWTSSDLTSWIETTSPFTETQSYPGSIAWTGEMLVAVGAGGVVTTSASGTEWEIAQKLQNANHLTAVASGSDHVVAVGLSGGSVVSPDGFDWEILPDTPGFRGIVYGNSQFLAVGTSGRVGTTVDGLAWEITNAGFGHLRDVTWTSSHYVAVGTGVWKIISSSDGLSWVLEEDFGNGFSYGVHSTPDAVVAVGSTWFYYTHPLVVVGTPGGPWEQNFDFVTDDFNGTWLYDVTYGNGRWVAVGAYGLVLASTDLDDWFVVDVGSDDSLYSVEWTGSEFIAAGSGGLAFSSFDGLNWIEEDLPTGLSLRGCTGFADDLFAVGSNGTIIRGGCDWPEDPPEAAFSVNPTQAEPNKSIHFASEASGYVQSVLWQFGDSTTSTASDPAHGYAEPGSFFVSQTVCNDAGCDIATAVVDVVLQPPQAAISWMGPQPLAGQSVLWQDVSGGPPNSWMWSFGDGVLSFDKSPRHIFDAAGIYQVHLHVSNDAGDDAVGEKVVVGSGAVVAASNDSEFVSIASTGDSLLAVTSHSAWTSSDGVSWSSHDLVDGFTPHRVEWHDGRFLAVGSMTVPYSSDVLANSVDGVVWQLSPVPDGPLRDVSFMNDVAVVVGYGGIVMRSYDLMTWWYGDSGTYASISDIVTDGNIFVAAADELLESTDGFTWTQAAGNPGDPSVVVFGDQGFWATTSQGVFFRDFDGVWVRYDDPAINQPQPGETGLAVVDSLVLTTGDADYASGDSLRWYSPQRRLWIENLASGGSEMIVHEDGVYILSGGEILKLGVVDELSFAVFADGFETGNLDCWSGVVR